jgi:hypothetical protein
LAAECKGILKAATESVCVVALAEAGLSPHDDGPRAE